MVVRRNSEISTIKKGMYILTKQEPIAGTVTAPERIRFDVSGIQHMQNVGVG